MDDLDCVPMKMGIRSDNDGGESYVGDCFVPPEAGGLAMTGEPTARSQWQEKQRRDRNDRGV